jgi:hypothetical protein
MLGRADRCSPRWKAEKEGRYSRVENGGDVV